MIATFLSYRLMKSCSICYTNLTRSDIMDRPSRITIDGIEYNLLTDEELGELVFIEKLEAQVDDIQAGRIKSIPLEELRNRYDEKIRNKGL